MQEKSNISSFVQQILRSPTKSLDAINRIPNSEAGLDLFVRELFCDNDFKESIFVASFELYSEWKSAYQSSSSIQKIKKLNRAILKYYIRSFSKCVPFGLFANYGIVKMENEENKLELGQSKKYLSFDSAFMTSVVRTINDSSALSEVLRYAPNNTIYHTGGYLRYIESNIVNGKRNLSLSAIERDEVIDLIINECRIGSTKSEITVLLKNNIEGVLEEDIISFVDDLISSQLLLSSLDIHLNGDNAFQQILIFLRDHAAIIKQDLILENYAEAFELINENLTAVEQSCNNNSLIYLENIISVLKKYKIPFQQKSLLGINLKKGYSNSSMQFFKEDEKQLKLAIHLLSSFASKSPEVKNSSLSKLVAFKKAFIERYEDREIPLMQALDNELGVGYLQGNKDNALFSEILDDLRMPELHTEIEKIQSEKVLDDFWFRILLSSLSKRDYIIDLKKEDLSKIELKKSELTGTFSMVYNKVGEKICMVMSGGSSALNLISRFSSDDLELQEFVSEISSHEERIFSEQIVAEIIHTPNVRAGNILTRKIKRKFEIPILSQGSPDATQINLNDLMVSIRNGIVHLRSKTHKKEVVPFLSSAQNFHYDSLPVFHFLCDMQAQYRSNILSLNFNPLINRYFNFIPRITFGEKLILSPATWKFSKNQLTAMIGTDGLIDFQLFRLFLMENLVPRHIVLIDMGEESLIIDTNNELMVSLLNDSLKKNNKLHFRECLYDIENDPDQYCNEFIMSFMNDERLPVSSNRIVIDDAPQKFIPGSEWLYFKLYTGMKSADFLLTDILLPFASKLIEGGLINKWFFIRFADPEFHLRIRFHFNREEDRSNVISLFNSAIEKYVETEMIWKIELATYVREITRYGKDNITLCEEVFFHDSDMICKLILELKKQKKEHLLWMYLFLSIDGLLSVFGLTLKEKNELAASCYDYFAKEFQVDKDLRKQLGEKFRLYHPKIELLQKTTNDTCLALIKSRDERIKGHVLHMSEIAKVNSQVISSLIHMSVNRAINSNARLHELVTYSLLEKYYKKKNASISKLSLEPATI